MLMKLFCYKNDQKSLEQFIVRRPLREVAVCVILEKMTQTHTQTHKEDTHQLRGKSRKTLTIPLPQPTNNYFYYYFGLPSKVHPTWQRPIDHTQDYVHPEITSSLSPI